MSESRSESRSLPASIYVWLVPSEQVLEQPGSWRIRKWDTEPFPEANFTLSSEIDSRDSIIEECAKECERYKTRLGRDGWPTPRQAHECAAAIRALKNAAPQAVRPSAEPERVIGNLGGEPAVAAPSAISSPNEHPETAQCGFDRNASHSENTYVCNCGWRDEGMTEAQKAAYWFDLYLEETTKRRALEAKSSSTTSADKQWLDVATSMSRRLLDIAGAPESIVPISTDAEEFLANALRSTETSPEPKHLQDAPLTLRNSFAVQDPNDPKKTVRVVYASFAVQLERAKNQTLSSTGVAPMTETLLSEMVEAWFSSTATEPMPKRDDEPRFFERMERVYGVIASRSAITPSKGG